MVFSNQGTYPEFEDAILIMQYYSESKHWNVQADMTDMTVVLGIFLLKWFNMNLSRSMFKKH